MTDRLLSDLARVKAIFQQRALVAMLVDQPLASKQVDDQKTAKVIIKTRSNE